MSGTQVMPGEAILGNAEAAKTETPLESIEALVAEHSMMAFRIAYSILRNHHDAEDAVQECFLRVLKHLKRMHQVRNPKTWLARIAWTTALDRRASRARVMMNEDASEAAGLSQIPDQGLAADEQLAGRQMQKLLEQMIATLPEELRYPLELSTVQELNSAEIAEIMHIPEGSVRTRLMRARQRLKERLSAVLEAKHG
ncbi:MAG TPA: RNA polymerase sigma factor [Candidatus Angelobacter sp.]|nr:RNA polymerase sigma factor [Candidatus Angelobacter sp.]